MFLSGESDFMKIMVEIKTCPVTDEAVCYCRVNKLLSLPPDTTPVPCKKVNGKAYCECPVIKKKSK